VISLNNSIENGWGEAANANKTNQETERLLANEADLVQQVKERNRDNDADSFNCTSGNRETTSSTKSESL